MPPKQRRSRGDGALYQRANGLWVGSVELPERDGKRRRREVSSMDYETAMRKLRALRRDVEDGAEPISTRATLGKWLTDEWLAKIICREVKPTTLVAYRATVARQIIPAIGAKKMDKLTARDVRAMVDAATSSKSTGTALNAYRVLSKALTDAKREGLILANPCERVRPPRVVRESRGSHPADDVRKLLAHLVEQGNAASTARWCLALFTGARQAECLGLEWERVDFDAGLVDYSWTLQWLRLEDRYARRGVGDTLYPREAFDVDPGFDFRPVWRTACLIPPKTEGSRRVVPMVAPLRAALAQHRGTSSGIGLVWTSDGARESRRPIKKADDAKEWHAMLSAAGVPDLTLHSARHTVGTLLMEAGVPEATRMQIMGHSTAAMARHYAHVDQTLTRDALERLDRMLRLE